MINSVGNSHSMLSLSQLQEKMFLKADVNSDGTIDVDEMSAMQANAPQGGPGSEGIFTELDADEDGAISRAESDAAIAKMYYERSQDGSGRPAATLATSSSMASVSSERLSELFSKIDTDGDGSVSKEEFIAGRLDNMSEEQVTAMWNQLDTTGSGSLTESDFVSAMGSLAPPQGPPPGPPPGGFGTEEDSSLASSDSTPSSSASSPSGTSTANSELVMALMNAISKYISTMEQSSSSATTATTAAGSLSLEA